MYQLDHEVTGFSEWIYSLTDKQLDIVQFLVSEPIVKKNLKKLDTIQKFVGILSNYSVKKMYGIVPISKVNELVSIKSFLDAEYNQSGNLIGFGKLIKLNDKLVVVYTKNQLNTNGGKQFNPFSLGSSWLGMS
jgi:hypothetical protein